MQPTGTRRDSPGAWILELADRDKSRFCLRIHVSLSSLNEYHGILFIQGADAHWVYIWRNAPHTAVEVSSPTNFATMSKLKEVIITDSESADVSQDDLPILHREDNAMLRKLGYKSEFKREFSVLLLATHVLRVVGLIVWHSS